MLAVLDAPSARRPSRAPFLVGLVLLIAFGVVVVHQLREVARLRTGIEQSVGLLIRTQGARAELERALSEGGRASFDRAALEAAAAPAAIPAVARAAVRAALDHADAGDTAEALAALDRAQLALRGSNRTRSEELGEYWSTLNGLAALTLIFAFAALGALWIERRSAAKLADARAQLAERLESTERGFEALIEAVPSGVVVQREGVIAYANPAMERALGAPPGGLVGTRLADRLTDEPADGALAGEHRFTREDGSIGQLEVVAGPEVSFEQGAARLAVVRDVSEHRLVESQLRLSERLAAVGSVTAGIAHEINNPLTFVLASASMLRDRLDEDELDLAAMHELVDDIREGSVRVRDVVSGLRTLAHPADDDVHAVELGPVIQSSLAIASSELSQRAKVFTWLDEGLPPVEGNETKIGQLLLNLLVNAAQAYDEGAPHGRVSVRAARVEDEVHISVEDDGRGMDEATRERVFEPFFTTKSVGEGTGLGLTISRRIVERLGGRIELTSAPGEGCKVTVVLRAAENAARESLPFQRVEAQQLKVLVIDDEPRVARSLARLLKGHDCVIEHGGRAGLDRAQREPFDLIFCDLMMPEVTGVDVYEGLRALGEGLEKRMVLVTGGAFTDRARAFVRDTSVRVVEKPFDRANVDAVLAKLSG